jgi:hypothetical protein
MSVEQRTDDRKHHSQLREEHAPSRTARRAEPLQSEDEKCRGDQVEVAQHLAGRDVSHALDPVQHKRGEGEGGQRRPGHPAALPCGAGAAADSASLLNIFSMRSVIRNPPTTLVEEQATAMRPSAVLSGVYWAPAITSDPTSAMPEMAFVTDISGVCSSGTRAMMWKPRNHASTKM